MSFLKCHISYVTLFKAASRQPATLFSSFCIIFSLFSDVSFVIEMIPLLYLPTKVLSRSGCQLVGDGLTP